MAHQSSLQAYIPFLKFKNQTATTWGSAGNSVTVSDPLVKSNSIILIQPTTLPAGRWYVSACAEGTFTVTSSDSEPATSAFKYLIL